MFSSFWHLAAACCVPTVDPKARRREKEIFRQVASDAKNSGKVASPGRWDENKARIEIRDDGKFEFTALVQTDGWTMGKKRKG
jgi:hypothetical protein